MDSSVNQKNFSLKKWVTLTSLLCALVLLGWGVYYYWEGTPRYSLYQMAKAIKNHDSQTFLLYFDMDKVVEGLVDSNVKGIKNKSSPHPPAQKPEEEKPSTRQGEFLKSLIPQIIKSLSPVIKQKLIQAIEDTERKNKIYPLAFCIFAKVERTGDNVLITMKDKKGKTYQFTMERTPRRFWQVVRLDLDLFGLFKKF